MDRVVMVWHTFVPSAVGPTVVPMSVGRAGDSYGPMAVVAAASDTRTTVQSERPSIAVAPSDILRSLVVCLALAAVGARGLGSSFAPRLSAFGREPLVPEEGDPYTRLHLRTHGSSPVVVTRHP